MRIAILTASFFGYDGLRTFNGGGDRYLIELARLIRLEPKLIYRGWKKWCQDHIHDHELHVAFCEALDEAGLSIGQIDGVSTYPGRAAAMLGFSPVAHVVGEVPAREERGQREFRKDDAIDAMLRCIAQQN